jgi:glyoxylase-like metal-dependent hydrolase (beta-lactamase superfamily II)
VGRDVEKMKVRFCDEFDGGFGWIVDEFLERCSHALVADGKVWVVDPVAGDGVEERIRAAGEPAGVIQLLNRHNRDCAALAERLGVPHHAIPLEAIPPFEFLTVVMNPVWKEVALWWPERRVLVCADALGTARYYRARKDRLALNPLLRPFPPRRKLSAVAPSRILCGHGEGLQEDAEAAVREALRTARRRIPAQFASAARASRATRSA